MQIFGNGHLCGRAHERALEHTRYGMGPLEILPGGHIFRINDDFPMIRKKRAGHGVQQRGFPGTVGADQGYEITGSNGQIDPLQGIDLVDSAGIKSLVQIRNFNHDRHFIFEARFKNTSGNSIPYSLASIRFTYIFSGR